MSIKTDAQVIRDENVTGANTALRVGSNLVAIADDLLAKQAAIDLNTAKETNIVHPLVETAVPIGAVFTDTDTVYDDTAIQAAVDLNTAKVGITAQQASDITANNAKVSYSDAAKVANITVTQLVNLDTIESNVSTNNAKVSNVDHPLVETAVPIGAVFTDTVYDDTDVLKDADALTPVTGINKLMTEADVASLGGGDMLSSVYDPIIDANTAKVGITAQQASDITANNAKVSNVAHPLVETAVPIGAVFTDTIYDDTAIQAAVDLNTAKVSNVDHPLVETAVPVGAVFTDTIYNDADVLKDADTVSPVNAGNKIITETDVAALGGGNVVKVGTPVNNQIGIWTGDGTIKGDADLTWDGESFVIANASNNILLTLTAASITNEPAFKINHPDNSKAFQFAKNGDSIAWASFEILATKPTLALGAGGAVARDTNLWREDVAVLKTNSDVVSEKNIIAQGQALLNRIEEDLAVTGSKALDLDSYETFNYVMIGNTGFSSTSTLIPVGYSKVITMKLSGAFAPTFPAAWTATYVKGTYDSATTNLLVLEYVRTPAGSYYTLQISQTD